METKEELKKRLEAIERKEEEEREAAELEKNYQKFKNRNEDLIIGKAHCDIGITKIDYSWYYDKFYSIGDAIHISGNCGTSYKANAPITSATHTYFHNVWSDKQRKTFQEKLNKVAVNEVLKIMSDLRCVLEIMGLQSDYFYLNNIYPKKRLEEIKAEIELERKKILDKYPDKDFKKLLTANVHDKSLYHSNTILKNYITKYRPKLEKYYQRKNGN